MQVQIEVFIATVFIFNAIPHLVMGICGKKHMTPFSPRSSALANVLWGWGNVCLGALLYIKALDLSYDVATCAAFVGGGLSISVFLALFWSNPDARLPWHGR